MSKAIVIGSINMDIVAIVERRPEIGETIMGREIKYFPGGKGFNQAVACKRMGCETLMVGRLGDDDFGTQLLDFLLQQGIETDGIKSLSNVATGCAFITVSDDGENSIIVISGANAAWEDDFTGRLNIEAGDVVLAQFEIPDSAILKAFKTAKECGATTILNPAPVRNLLPEIRELTDLFVVNEHELSAISEYIVNPEDNESIFRAAESLCDGTNRTVIVTLGDKGVRISNHDVRHAVAAKPVAAVDTTAAGDTFIGGMAAGLLTGLDLLQAAELGNAAASIGVTRMGAASSIPTYEEVSKIL